MPKRFIQVAATWQGTGNLAPFTFDCAFCGDCVNSQVGLVLRYAANSQDLAWVRICPGCQGPNVFGPGNERYPGVGFGDLVPNLPDELAQLYEEARASASACAYTAAVLVCRKMLMNIAVAQGAKEGKHFIEYVEHLSDKGFVPPNGKGWVDYIRQRGNEATHEIKLMKESDAKALITFVEMLLRFIYEFPQMVPATFQKP
jgi:hypothetical protein